MTVGRFAARLTNEIRTLADYLLSVPHGGWCSYRQIANVTGVDCQQNRYLLNRARDLLLHESGAVFDTLHGRGLRRLLVEDIPGIGGAARKRSRLAARRGRRVMNAAIGSFNDVSPEIQRRVMAEDGMLHLLEHIAADRNIRKLETHDKPIPVAAAARTLLQLIGA